MSLVRPNFGFGMNFDLYFEAKELVLGISKRRKMNMKKLCLSAMASLWLPRWEPVSYLLQMK